MDNKNTKIRWLDEPRDQDYEATKTYLSLIYAGSEARRYVKKLKRTSVTQFKSKDIFRASGLEAAGAADSHVEKERQKVEAGEKLAPLLLVRDSINGKVVIGDGYHRLCAVNLYDEDAEVPCKIV